MLPSRLSLARAAFAIAIIFIAALTRPQGEHAAFLLTGKQNHYPEARAWLTHSYWSEYRPSEGAYGVVHFGPVTDSNAEVLLCDAARTRYLVECTVRGTQVHAQTRSRRAEVGGEGWRTLSILTAPGESWVLIDSVPALSSWALSHCMIRRSSMAYGNPNHPERFGAAIGPERTADSEHVRESRADAARSAAHLCDESRRLRN